jgi:anti-sigma B factor antagonist
METHPNQAFDVELEHVDGTTTAALKGELDMSTAPRLTSIVLGLSAAGHATVVLNLSGLEFCDSSGLDALVGAHRHLESTGGHLELRAPSCSFRKVLQITAMDRILDVHP